MLLLLTTGCSPKQPTSSTTSPTVSATASVQSTFVAKQDEADLMRAKAPEGWTELPVDDTAPLDYLASRDGTTGFSTASIRAWRFAPEIIANRRNITLDEPDSYDLDLLIGNWLHGMLADSRVSSFSLLPARTIGGAPARGYTYIRVSDGLPTRYEAWEVGRRDGLWDITLNSAPGETELPPELDGILDTITWTDAPNTPTTPST
ncbi:hypothetical protein DDD63_07990 [Actinobaculum sp. 313]|nr:hypothetical protein DDD63_07990 [Actinobaculum sp. 313]